MNKRHRYLYGVLIIAALVMAVIGVSLTSNLVSEAARLQANFRDNPVSVSAQADHELLILIDRLERFGRPESGVDQQEVIDRFDVVWSRMETNSSGSTGRYYLELEGAAATVADLRRTLEIIEPRLLSLAADDTETARELAAVLRTHSARVHAVTLKAGGANAEFASRLHDSQRRAGFLASLFLPGMLIAGFAVAGVLWLERRQLNQLNLNLERRVKDRTSEILRANERLRQEVDDRRRVEETLRASDERFRDMTANVPGVVYQFKIDAAGEMSFPYVSETIETMLGLRAADVVADASVLLDCVHPDDRDDLYASIAKTHRTLDSWNWEGRVTHASGDTGWFRGSATPRRLDDGAALWNGLVVDITEMKQTEERLRQSQKMEAVGQLTGGIAHDFNNLLAVVQGNVEILGDTMEGNPELATIERATARGAELTQRLLAFSRQQPLRPQAIDLGESISGLDDLIQRTLGAPVRTLIHVPDDSWPVSADPGQFENAILNLAINARDAMPGGGILEIRCKNMTLREGDLRVTGLASGDYVRVSVRDTGTGMTDEAREHAFEPFFTTKDTGQGSGLGLSMVYGFARQSGGDAVIDSVLGSGTQVSLYLPRASTAEVSTAPEKAEDLKRGNNEVILVLEDETDVRNLAVTILEGLGYRVLEAPDAKTAMKVLENSGHVDLLLSDVVLPGAVSGPEFAAKAKALQPHIRIVFMSGYAADALSDVSRMDFDEILLSKPFRRSDLANAMHQSLA